MKTLLELHISNDEKKLIRLLQGDLAAETKPFDLVICSAYKGRYWPTDRSFIGSLFWDRNISVDLLSRTPAIDMRNQGFWISREIDSNFRRIGCIELLEYGHTDDPAPVILKSKYSTMRYALEQASYTGIPLSNVAMPFLGIGEQQIEMQYMACVLWQQLTLTLQSIDSLNEINLYERDPDKASALAEIIRQIAFPKEDIPKIFISYSSKQFNDADRIRKIIENNGHKCWMAPESIPAGSSYLKEIPIAIDNSDIIVLVLTPDAEKSEWVPKEVGTAVGMRKKVIPFRQVFYDLGLQFTFLLHNVQILTVSNWEDGAESLLKEIKNYYIKRGEQFER